MTTYLFNKGYIYPIGYTLNVMQRLMQLENFGEIVQHQIFNNVNISRYLDTMIFLIKYNLHMHRNNKRRYLETQLIYIIMEKNMTEIK